ncbi:initiation factor 2B related protein [Halococcus thailandensis]|uniref:Initiation factor 2B related protein n=1 Tax=Halococcus thailandensis JCM 13552 TaxID=1227457 RepID=M0MYG7_9EURY|nr:initiation factor 2B related protein [Halococcus thailandensis]EMA50363.1 initiation factor 2B related protein [Halococcus thailandensis JCM 13552]
MGEPRVACFLRNRGEILLVRGGDGIDSNADRWSALIDDANGNPDGAAHAAIRERTVDDATTLVRAGKPFMVEVKQETRWQVHPYLFDCDSQAVETDDEIITEFAWVSPTEIHRRETIPDLWKSYERVAPTIETIQEDTDHGSAWLSVRALEVLRDRAGALATTDGVEADGWDDLAALARDLRTARPSMTAIGNRINRAMAEASARTPTAVEESSRQGIQRALDADSRAASEATARLSGTVLTLSRSGTVLEALREATVERVIVAESRPAREGVGVAEALASDDDCRVTLAVDAAAAHVLAEHAVDSVLVGADTIRPDGSVTNKVGTRAVAIAAAREGVPVHAVAASDKIATDADARFEPGDPAAVYDGDAEIEVLNPTFDRTPADAITVVTEDGALGPTTIGEYAERLAGLAAWDD